MKFFWDNKDQLLNGMRTGEIVGAMMWDTGGWKLNSENPDIQFIAPKSGALGWIDTFALPAKGRNDAAAYAWINFNMRPEDRRQGRGVGRQLHRLQGRRPVDGREAEGAVRRQLPRSGAEERQVVSRRCRPASRRSKAACSTASRRPIERRRAQRMVAAVTHPAATPPPERCRSRSERVVKRFGGHIAVEALSFGVARGSFFSILGPSGCGKTTLLRMIAGFIAPDGGDIRIGGRVDARRGAEPAPGEHGVPAPGAVPDDVGRRKRRLRPGAARRGARRDHASASARCWSASAWPARRPSASTSSRAARSSAWPSRAAWCSSRRCCCSTNRWARST